MSKIIYTFLVGIFVFMTSMNAQLTIGFVGQNADAGNEVIIDVTATNFTDIPAAQFSINWDPEVMTFASFSDLNTKLTGFTIGAHLNNPGPNSDNLDPGQISWGWYATDGIPVTLDPNEVMFKIHYTNVGQPCDETDVAMTGTPLAIGTSTADFEPGPDPVSTPTTIQINGTNCNGGGSNDVTFSISDYTLPTGQDTCVVISVTNFTDVEGFQFPLSWDASVLTYNSFNVLGGTVPGTFVVVNPEATNEVTVLWTESEGNASTFDDGTNILEICFTGSGNAGDVSGVDFVSVSGTINNSVIGGNGTIAFNNGSITLTDGIVIPVQIYGSTEIVAAGANVCVDVSVKDFTNVSGMQGSMTWNQSLLTYTGIEVVGSPTLPGLVPGFFSENSGLLTFTWTSPSGDGIDVADNEPIFRVCFDAIGNCDNAPPSPSSPFTLITDPGVAVKWQTYIKDAGADDPVTTIPVVSSGAVNYDCPTGECMVVSVDHPDCAGESGGNILVNLTSAAAGCTCVWTNAAGTQVGSTLTTPNCNLNGVPAGTYNIKVTCGTEVYCETTGIELIDPTAIVVNGTVTPIGCTSSGEIKLTVTGGVAPYTYVWNGGLTGGPTVAVTTAGTYCVTVSDNNGCSAAEKCFVVTSNLDNFNAAINIVKPISCANDSDGELMAVPTGGCPSYSYLWSTGATTASIASIGANTYNVTITDSKGTEATASMTLTAPAPIVLDEVNIVDATSANNDGEIDVKVVIGGTAPYSYKWSNNATTSKITGLSAGDYTVTVTDANGCVKVSGIYTIITFDGINVKNIVFDKDFNGYNVSCNSSCDGVVSFIVSGAALPMNIKLKSTVQEEEITSTTNGKQTIPKICGGISDAVIIITDANGVVFTTEEFEITQPVPLTIDSEVDCSDGLDENGAIKIIVSGGVKEYSYLWGDGSTLSTRTDLKIDKYNVIVTDANGCQVMANDIKVTDCTSVDGTCFEANEIMTPNGDGFNDQLVINCATAYDNTLTIYTRYGEKVYSASNYNNSWEGDNLAEGGYMWVLNVRFETGEANKTKKGTFAILR